MIRSSRIECRKFVKLVKKRPIIRPPPKRPHKTPKKSPEKRGLSLPKLGQFGTISLKKALARRCVLLRTNPKTFCSNIRDKSDLDAINIRMKIGRIVHINHCWLIRRNHKPGAIAHTETLIVTLHR